MPEDQIKGAIKQGFGHLQDAAGGLTGDMDTQARGKLNQAAGVAQRSFGEAVDTAQEKYGELESFLRNQPVAAIGIGFVLGYIVNNVISFRR